MIEPLENLINDIITTLYADPIYLVIAVILSGLLIFSLLKRLMKFALYVLAVGILYLGYLYYTGESLDDVMDRYNKAEEFFEEKIDEVVKKNDWRRYRSSWKRNCKGISRIMSGAEIYYRKNIMVRIVANLLKLR